MAIPTVSLTAAGISAPSYPEVLAAFQDEYRSIYGSDVNLESDTQDGQWIAIQARAYYNWGQAMIGVYNAFSPTTAQGAGLSSVVKINGLARETATNSSAVVTIAGQAGTIITGGIVGDGLGLNTQWNLSEDVVIPIGGTIDATVICATSGAVTAAAGSLTSILTPIRGWQTVTNADAATVGSPVETDATLRRRQSASTSLPAQTILDGIFGSVSDLAGVTRVAIYENDTDVTDANGLDPHSIAAVVLGGTVSEIATAIADKKAPGTGTNGDIIHVVIDDRGVPNTIRYYALDEVPLTLEIDITAQLGYVSTTEDQLKAAVAAYINALSIGEDSYLARLYTPANLGGTTVADTFVVTAIRQARDGDPPAAANVVLTFRETATCDVADITVAVT